MLARSFENNDHFVNYAAQKAELLGCIVAVPTDVVFRDLGVQSEKGIHAPGLAKM
jgi:hypothetical protein